MTRLKYFLPIVAMLLALSCQKVADPKGSVQLAVMGNDLEFAAMPPVENFNISLTDGTLQLWNGKLSGWDAGIYAKDMPVSDKLKVEASFGDIKDEGFDKPYWYGSQNFSFEWQDITVGVPVQLMNCCVKIECTELFKSYFPEYEFVIVTPYDNEIKYARTQTGLVFLAPGTVKVKGKMSTYEGEPQELQTRVYENLAAGRCHTFTLDVSDIGGLHVDIVFDDEVEEVNLGEISIDSDTPRVGTLSLGGLNVSCEQELQTKVPVPADGDYRVTVSDSRGQALMNMSYSEACSIDGGIALPVGNYFLSVRSTDEEIPSVGFDCPVYGFELPFKIEAGKLTELKGEMVCRLLQFVVAVEFDDDFLAAVTADSKVHLRLSSGQNVSLPVRFDGKAGTFEKHKVYFLLTEESTALTVGFMGYISGRYFVAEKTYSDVTAASIRKVRFTLAK